MSVTTILVLPVTANEHFNVVPLHPPPLQPPKTISGSGVTVSFTVVLDGTDMLHLLLAPVRQEIPDGLLSTAPVPVPLNVTLTSKFDDEPG